MNDGARRRSALTSAQRLTAVAVEMAEKVNGLTPLARIHDHQGNLRGSSYDSARAKVSDVSDPTANAPSDVASRDLRKLDRMLQSIEFSVRDIESILDAYGPARVASELDRLALQRLNIEPMAGCANCARVTGPTGRARWEPADSRCPGPTTAAGKLAEPVVLCSWCRNRLDLWGRLPSERELQRHHEGHKVPWPKDVPRPG
jgi:hypothetical protein